MWMRSLLLNLIGLLLALLASTASCADALQPVLVPGLIVGASPPQSFIAQGRISPQNVAGGFAFHVVSSGERQFFALYDPADGTPMYISDGKQSLIYDLERRRLVHVPNSRGYVSFDLDDNGKSSFSFGLQKARTLAELDPFNSRFRFDRLLTPAEFKLTTQPDARLRMYENVRSDGSVGTLENSATDDSWFRYTRHQAGHTDFSFEFAANDIQRPIPAEAIRFPDLKRLAKSISIVEFNADEESASTDRSAIDAVDLVRLSLLKSTLATQSENTKEAEKLMPNVDWQQIRRTDAEFGNRYRAALAGEGIQLHIYKLPTPT